MDAVLDVFVRVNSGGTVLSKSDMLFSTVVSKWTAARNEFDDLLSALRKTVEMDSNLTMISSCGPVCI